MLAILLFAGAIRFYGIYWGAPERIDLHPDECEYVMGHALSLSLHDLDPHFLNYPTFLMYLIAGANGVFKEMGWIHDPWQSYLIGRAIVASFGALTALAAFLLAMELGSGLLGASLAGIWLALLPLHAWESHTATTDIPMAFWITMGLYASARLLHHRKAIDFIMVGALIGFATASKYTAALLAVAPVAAMVAGHAPWRIALKNLTLAAATALLCAFIATPYSFLHLQQTLAAMAYENVHVHGGHFGFSTLSGHGIQYHPYAYELLAGWPFSMGIALYASSLCGLVWILLHPTPKRAVILTFFFVFFGLIGSWTFTPLRYSIPVLILMAIFAGMWQEDWIRSRQKWKRIIAAAMIAGTAIYTSIFTFETDRRFRHDTRVTAQHWLDQTMKPGQHLLLCGYHYYQAIPGNPDILTTTRRQDFIARPNDLNPFDLIEISSLFYDRYERNPTNIMHYAYAHFRHTDEFHLIKRFSADFINKDFYTHLDPMFESYFISPTLEFYAPKEKSSPIDSSAKGHPGSPA